MTGQRNIVKSLPNKGDKLVLSSTTTGERTAEIAAVIASAAPWIGGPIAEIVGGVATSLKIRRVTEFVKQVLEKVESVHTQGTEEFVRTEDFIDIFEKTAQVVANERSEKKRTLFFRYIINNIADPTIRYDVRLKALRTIEQIDMRHVDLLMALLSQPTKEEAESTMGSPNATIQRRAPQLKHELDAVIHETNTLRLTNIEKGYLRTTMTGEGASNLRHSVTDLGQMLMRFLTERIQEDDGISVR